MVAFFATARCVSTSDEIRLLSASGPPPQPISTHTKHGDTPVLSSSTTLRLALNI
jgi:hypothetical protein